LKAPKPQNAFQMREHHRGGNGSCPLPAAGRPEGKAVVKKLTA
jgi:hypothetical protein